MSFDVHVICACWVNEVGDRKFPAIVITNHSPNHNKCHKTVLQADLTVFVIEAETASLSGYISCPLCFVKCARNFRMSQKFLAKKLHTTFPERKKRRNCCCSVVSSLFSLFKVSKTGVYLPLYYQENGLINVKKNVFFSCFTALCTFYVIGMAVVV